MRCTLFFKWNEPGPISEDVDKEIASKTLEADSSSSGGIKHGKINNDTVLRIQSREVDLFHQASFAHFQFFSLMVH